MPFKPSWLVVVGFGLLAGSNVSAQTSDGGPDPETVRARIGPVWIKPAISIPAFGIDTNVFNEPESARPKEDLAIVMNPKADMWVRMGRTWLSGGISEELVWFRTYASERSSNETYLIAWKAPLNRVSISAGASRLDSRARPGFEIDARAERTEPAYNGGIEVRGFARTFIGVRGSSRKVSFDETATFDGHSLKAELDRKETTAAVTLRQDLTPLTSLTFGAGRSEQSFRFSTGRDSKSTDYTVAVNFDPAALIKGSASVGYTLYRPESRELPEYRGLTTGVNLTFAPLESTEVTGTITRNVEFSYDNDQPYYLSSGLTASISQQIFGPVDVVARAGAQRLEYRSRTNAVDVVTDRTDRVRSYGIGIGYRIGRELRAGFDLDRQHRTSPLRDREYEGKRYGVSLTYVL
jgi:hypothetical protein